MPGSRTAARAAAGRCRSLVYRPEPVQNVVFAAAAWPAAMQIASDDPTAAVALAAIYDDLGSGRRAHGVRDHLQEQGDPRGELIALQLARHATGTPPTEREREPIAKCATRGPLAPYLRSGQLRRTLAACAVAEQVLPEPILRDVAWSTVEQLHTFSDALLGSPALVSAWRVGIEGMLLARASHCQHELPFEVIGGYQSGPELGPEIDQPGILCEPADWDAVVEVGALARLRALSVAAASIDPDRVTAIARSRLGKQLRHLDVMLGFTPVPDIERWRTAFDRARCTG
jgi:hypothetical protein